MLKIQGCLLGLTLALSACAHHALRVNCEGPLRPINLPAPEGAPKSPVSVSPDLVVPGTLEPAGTPQPTVAEHHE